MIQMRQAIAVFILFLLLPLHACSQAVWQEGTHYIEMPNPVSEEKKVTEVFSFWCPHCYNMEQFVALLKPKLAEDVAFEKVHLGRMGGRPTEIQDSLTRGMLVARALGVEDKFNKAAFDLIHKYRGDLNTEKDIKNIFIINQLGSEQFDELFTSGKTWTALAANNAYITERGQFIRGVPAFIVNDKYLVTFTREMSLQDRFDLINWLTGLK